MNIIDAVILGIIQGLTEFLPVSSSGHIALGSSLLGLAAEENLLFSVVVHAATALSTIIVFRTHIFRLIRNGISLAWNEEKRYILKIALSMIPIGIVGVLLEDYISAFFGENITFVGAMLLITAVLLLFTYFSKEKDGEVTYSKSILIGIAQAIAILPGISRSGSTIAVALLLGVEKSKAAKFSFLMVLVPILGASALKLQEYMETPVIDANNLLSPMTLLAGFIAAFLSGLMACNWMISLVKKGKLIYFAYYCFAAGALAILVGSL